MSFYTGGTITVKLSTYDDDGDLFTPGSGTFQYAENGDTVGTSVALSSFTNTATGKYEHSFTAGDAGGWWWKLTLVDGGGNTFIKRGTFDIDP